MRFAKIWGETRKTLVLISIFLILVGSTACVAPEEAEDVSSSTRSNIFSIFDTIARLIGLPGSSDEGVDPETGRVCTVDRYQQDPGQNFDKADILFVQDTSGSMRDEWGRVAENVQHMMHELPADVDVRVGVILAHVGRQAGKMYSARGEPKVLSNRNLSNDQIGDSLYKTFRAGSEMTDPALGEAAFFSLNKAVTAQLNNNQQKGFFRPDAVLAIVFLSDEHEIGFPFPEVQPQGLPDRCDEYWENRLKRVYYDSRNITLASTLANVRRLKGEVPVTTHAFVNITPDDLFKHNDPNARCLYDSLGYGYFDMIALTGGVLFSIQEDRTEGMIRIGKAVNDSLDLIHDFKLSKDSTHVDPETIVAVVDSRAVSHDYDADSNLVHLEDAGTFSSQIVISHCDFYQFDWVISNFKGEPTFSTITASWLTIGSDTKALLRVGLSENNLTFREYDISSFKSSHLQLIEGLAPETTYYLQVVATDKFGGEAISEVIAVTTLVEPIDWEISDFGGTTTHESASLVWKTIGENTRAVLLVGLSPDELTREISIDEFKVDHGQLVNNLDPLTVYFFKVIAEDNRGRFVESGVISLKTKDVPPPEWSILGLDAAMNKFDGLVIWQTSDGSPDGGVPTKAILRVGLSEDNLSFQEIVIGSFENSHQQKVEGLRPDTLYFFQVEAEDERGRVQFSNIIQKRTKADPIDWSINGFQGTALFDRVSLSWNTGAEPTKAVLKVGLSEGDLSFREISVSDLSVSHVVLVDGLEEKTTYFFQVVAEDEKQRKLASQVIAVTTPEEPIDWRISDFGGFSTFDTIDASWNTGDEPTKAVLKVGLSPDDLSFRQISLDEFKTNQFVPVDGLQELTTYFLQVVATDNRNRSATSEIIAITTHEEPIFWRVNALQGDPTYNSIALSWNTSSDKTNAVVKVGLSADNLTLKVVSVPDFATSHSGIQIEELQELTTYFIQVVATDERNRSLESEVISVTTLEEPIFWSVDDLNGVPTFNSVALSWSTGIDPTSAVINVGLSPDDLSFKQVLVSDAAISHNVVVDGLQELTTYYFQVIATDSRNRSLESNVISVTTLEEPIFWRVNDLQGVPTYNTIDLTWKTGSDNTKALVKIGLSANDLSFKQISVAEFKQNHQVLIEGLQELTTYFIQVVATDERNRPLESQIIPVTTLEEPIFWSINDLQGVPTYNTVTLSWNTGSDANTALIKVGLSPDDLTFKQVSVTNASVSHSVEVDGLQELTTYYFQVVSTDDRNRSLESEVISVTTLEEPIFWAISDFGGSAEWNQALLSWKTTGEPTKAVLLVGLSADDLSFKVIEINDRNEIHSQLVEGLSELTTYFFQVKAIDTRDRELVSEIILLTTPVEPILWNIENLAANLGFRDIQVSWNTSGEATKARIQVGLSAGDLTLQDFEVSDFSESHSVAISGLDPDTTYFIKVTAIDDRDRTKNQLISAATVVEEWRVLGLDASGAPTKLTVIWQTQDAPTKGVIRLGLSPGDLTLVEFETEEFLLSHLVEIDGLTPNTRYYFQVEAFDEERRKQISGIVSKKTKQ